MGIAFIIAAFLCGLGAKAIKLPPLVGYLAAGFALHAMGFSSQASLEEAANIGITLMLFTIGLKINIRDLLDSHIWGSTISHTVIWMGIIMGGMLGLSAAAWLTLDLSMQELAVIVFAMSFSSTVCVIKVLEDAAEVKSRQASVAIGVLIIQDLIAVGFLVLATGKVPTLWAVGLIALPFLKPVIDKILKESGHGELLPLSGVVLALGAYALFESVNIKGDLGALAVGIILAGSDKAGELYKSLISFKDLFLIAFFLSIGLSAVPSVEMTLTALALCLLLPLKFLMFFGLFSAFSLRTRSAFLSALLLSNFSEFGLIVAALSVEMGILGKDWLVVLAITVAVSFVLTSIIYRYGHRMQNRFSPWLRHFQRSGATEKNQAPLAKNAEVIIVGMGRVGCGAFHSLQADYPTRVWGVEVDPVRVGHFHEDGLSNVLQGDASDIEFWEAQDFNTLKLVMIALPSVSEMCVILNLLRTIGYPGKIATVLQYEDDRVTLEANGVDVAFNYYTEVGAGFAEESRHLLSKT